MVHARIVTAFSLAVAVCLGLTTAYRAFMDENFNSRISSAGAGNWIGRPNVGSIDALDCDKDEPV
jgi:hypothetical protein